MSRATYSELLNWGVAFWYLVAAAVIAACLKVAVDLLVGRVEPAHRTRMAVLLAACGMGLIAVTFGGGAHFADVARHAQHRVHEVSDAELLFSLLQFVGAPLALAVGWVLIRKYVLVSIAPRGTA